MNYNHIPRDSFIGQYLAYMEGFETAKVYDLFCGMWTLSAVLGRSVYVDRPRIPAYLNLFGIIVGDSGVTRKSTAVDVARKVLFEFNELAKVNEAVLVIDGKVTPDKMEVTLGEQSERTGRAHAAVLASELAANIGRSSSGIGLPILLTDLYDCPSLRVSGGTLSRVGCTIRNCYVSFLAASTSRWLSRAVSPNIIEGGFTSRCFFVVGERRKQQQPWPEDQLTSSPAELAAQLYKLQQRALAHGPIQLNEAAKKEFKEWYATIRFAEDAFSASFSSRIDAHVLSVAGLLAINNGVFVIQSYELKNAIQIVSEFFENGRMLFDEVKLVESAMTKAIQRLLDALTKASVHGMAQALLYKQVRHAMTKIQFDDLLGTLHELDMVQRFEIPAPGRPTKTVWRATALLTDQKLLDALYDTHAAME